MTKEFDGHRFKIPGYIDQATSYFWAIEIACRARRGDAIAAELLNAFCVTINDADGKQYWPMKAQPPSVGTLTLMGEASRE